MSDLVSFTVQGSGAFPVDMLRYDHCWPHKQEDIFQAFSCQGDRKVELAAYRPGRKGQKRDITNGRWLSFGWKVIKVKDL